MDNEKSMSDSANPLPAVPVGRAVLGLGLGGWTMMIGSCLVTAICAYFVGLLNTKAPYLRQSPPTVVAYGSTTNRIGIYAFTVTNDGSKEAEDIVCSFNCPDCHIKEIAATPQTVSPVFESKGDSYATVKVALLNPKEFVSVWVLVDRPEKLLEKCEVSVRGRGVVGEVAAIRAL